MNKIVIYAILMLTSAGSIGQTQTTKPDAVPQTQNNVYVNYRLFSTKNMWTFIKLDTRNGLMWQVQYDTDGNNRGQIRLNSEPQVSKEKEVKERFTLYTTQNMFTLILLDQLDGRTWQVQWSFDAKERLLIPIE